MAIGLGGSKILSIALQSDLIDNKYVNAEEDNIIIYNALFRTTPITFLYIHIVCIIVYRLTYTAIPTTCKRFTKDLRISGNFLSNLLHTAAHTVYFNKE